MLDRIEGLLLDLAVVSILGLGGLITASVFMRAMLNSGVADTVVIVQELMIAAILLPLAAATAARAHIVVEVLSKTLSRRSQDWLILFGSLFGLLALAPLIYAGWREAAHNLSNGAFFFGQLNLPKWPGRIVFLTGISFCWLRLLVMAWGDLLAIRAGTPLARDRENR